MQYAIINGERKTAEPKLKAICGHCGNTVQAKCGSKVVWHWAHVSTENCDTWYEPETQWHRDWKNNFGSEYSEISLVKEGVRHIADVHTKNDLVIEFQNSPISSETIIAREVFYEKMIWVINGAPFKENFQIWDKEFAENWDLKIETLPDVYLSPVREKAKVLVVQVQNIKHEAIKDILLKHKFIYSEQNNRFYYDLKDLPNSFAIEAKIRGNILELYREQKTEQKFKPVLYTWNPPRKSWLDAKAPVFIDFNEDYLIWIKTGIGSIKGEGVKVFKKDFMAKYV